MNFKSLIALFVLSIAAPVAHAQCSSSNCTDVDPYDCFNTYCDQLGACIHGYQPDGFFCGVSDPTVCYDARCQDRVCVGGPINEGGACSDGSVCTTSDHCSDGWCQ